VLVSLIKTVASVFPLTLRLSIAATAKLQKRFWSANEVTTRSSPGASESQGRSCKPHRRGRQSRKNVAPIGSALRTSNRVHIPIAELSRTALQRDTLKLAVNFGARILFDKSPRNRRDHGQGLAKVKATQPTGTMSFTRYPLLDEASISVTVSPAGDRGADDCRGPVAHGPP